MHRCIVLAHLTSLSKDQDWRLVGERHLVDAQGVAVAEQTVQVRRDVPNPAEERRGARVGGFDVLGRDKGRFVQVFLGEQHNAGDCHGLRGVSKYRQVGVIKWKRGGFPKDGRGRCV